MKFRVLLRYLPQSTLWTGICASFLAAGANIGIVALLSRRLTDFTTPNTTFVLQFAGAALLVVVLDFGVKWLLSHLTAGISFRLRSDLSRRILLTPLAQLEAIGAPRLLAALTDDVHTLVIALSQIPSVTMGAAVLLGCFVYLAWLSPPTLLLAGLFTLPAIVGQLWLRNKAQRSRTAAVVSRNRLFTYYRMLTEGVKELKMHRPRRAAFQDHLLHPTAVRYEEEIRQSHQLHHLAASWTQAIYFLFILAVFVLAGFWQLNSTILTSFALVALYARTSMNGLFAAFPFLVDAAVAAAGLERLGMRLSSPVKEAPPMQVASAPLHLCLRAIHHTYWVEGEESPFHLGPITLEMKSGELIFLIGGNGSGKTTLAKLLLGLYTPESGEIEWSGQRVTAEILDDYRQLFSVVFADFFLFDDLLGLEEIGRDTRANDYLHKFQLAHKVQVAKGALSTLDLSTGQRQRLALLTAYLEDRPIYLFDEWAAGQDPLFKELFYRQLLPELRNRGKLVIVISHDDHYYDCADRVLKLDSGQIEYDREKMSG
jgi:putative ATP-binding cassette transporter